MSHEHHDHEHHAMPTSGLALTQVAISATLHCLTGCAIGEVLGMIIGTAAGFSNWGTVALSVALAFFFGYLLTSLPLLRAGFALAAVVPIALASDTLSIATMEIVDNAIMVVVPGAMKAGLGSVLFWGSLAFALVIAGAVAVPVNRYLIARGKGHAVVHETGIHGGVPPRVVGIIAAVAFVFGTSVLAAEGFSGDNMGHGGGGHAGGIEQAAVRGLAVSENGLALELDRTSLPRDSATELRFKIVGSDGRAVRDFEVEHAKRLHLILVRRDMTGFQHLHPALAADGTWTTAITLPDPGSYRVFADFKRDGRNHTLGADLSVDGPVDWHPLPARAGSARTAAGHEVRISGEAERADRESELHFAVTRSGQPARLEPYLGARGHLVALREGDLAFLHVHPVEGGKGGDVTFATEFPSPGRYRLFLQFKEAGRVHTAAFTRQVGR